MPMAKPDQKFRAEQVVAATADGPPIFIPRNVKNVSLVVIPGAAGAATAQYTLASTAEIIDDPGNVDWVNWAAGSVSTITGQAAIGSIVAVRLTGVTVNPGKLQVCGDPT